MAMESCAAKTLIAGTAGQCSHPTHNLGSLYPELWLVGFGLGAFFSLMSASFAYEDPLLRQRSQAGMNTTQKASQIFKEMGRGMYTTGKGFGKVGALFAGIECVIEGVRLHQIFREGRCSAQKLSIVLRMTFGTQYRQDFLLVVFSRGTPDLKQLSAVVSRSQLSLRSLMLHFFGENLQSMFSFTYTS